MTRMMRMKGQMTKHEEQRPTKHANNAKETHRYRRCALEFWGAKATCLYSSAVCRRLSVDGLRTIMRLLWRVLEGLFGTFATVNPSYGGLPKRACQQCRFPQKARNSRVASRVPDYFLTLLIP